MIRAALSIAMIASFLAMAGDGMYQVALHYNYGTMYSPHDNAAPPYMPPEGMVPDAKTAVGIAEAVLTTIYGADTVASERPFHARLYGDRWVVHGTFWCPLCFGGVAQIEISKIDGRILHVMHGK